MIQGKGFFQIQLPDGDTAYTRAGNFQLDTNGNIVDRNGNPLQPQITIPAAGAEHHHRSRRHRQLHAAGTTAAQTAGQIQLANFANPGGLNSIGNGLFMPTDASGDADRRQSRAARTGWARCSKAISNPPTSASWRSSST